MLPHYKKKRKKNGVAEKYRYANLIFRDMGLYENYSRIPISRSTKGAKICLRNREFEKSEVKLQSLNE